MGEVATYPNRAGLAKRSDLFAILAASTEPDARHFSQYMLPQNKPRSAILTREVDFRAGFEEARHILCTSFACMPRRCCLNTSVTEVRRPCPRKCTSSAPDAPCTFSLIPPLSSPSPHPYNALPKWHLFLRFDAHLEARLSRCLNRALRSLNRALIEP
jgi:hypothetical protein